MAKGALILALLCILALIVPGLPSVRSFVHVPSVNASQVETTASGLLPSDVDGDGVVGPKDLAIIAAAYDSHAGLPRWDSRADIDGDGAVGLRDLVTLAGDYGKITWRAYGFDEPFNWTVTGGTWKAVNGSLDGFSSSESLAFAEDFLWQNCVLNASLKIASDSPRAEAALCFRLGDTGDFYWAGIGSWDHRVSISRMINHVGQELVFAGGIGDVAEDIWYNVSIKTADDSILLYLNNLLELSVNDTTFSGGAIGVRTMNSHVIVDNVTVVGVGRRIEHDVLYADGTELRDPSGQEVTLVGTQIDYNTLDRDIWFGADDVQKIKSYGGVVLELHILLFKDMMPQRGVLDQNWINRLDEWVSWCEQEQIYCIISFGNFEYKSWGRETPDWFLEGKYPTPWDKNLTNQASIDFWDIDNPLQDDNRQNLVDAFKFLANRYKNNRYVLFGLINEPFAGNDLVNDQNAEHLSVAYARFVERITDAIRSTGAKQLIFVDKPYCWFYTSHFEPVNRDGIVWEDHLYVSTSDGIDEWKAQMNQYVQTYVYDFHKPFYVGEYGIYPFEEYQNQLSNWRTTLAEQVAFMKTLPVCGYSWHEYPLLEGEYYDYVANILNADDSQYILTTIFG